VAVILYLFTALNQDRDLVLTGSVVPGETDLFRFIRDFGTQHAKIGRYRRLDLNPDSQSLGFHLFENGTVKIDRIYRDKTKHDERPAEPPRKGEK
jgi:hypothetical protein